MTPKVSGKTWMDGLSDFGFMLCLEKGFPIIVVYGENPFGPKWTYTATLIACHRMEKKMNLAT